jgi:hypothetical protein
MTSMLRRIGARRVHDGFGTLSFEIALESPDLTASTWPFGPADHLIGPGSRARSTGRGAVSQRGYGPANVA